MWLGLRIAILSPEQQRGKANARQSKLEAVEAVTRIFL